MGLEITEQVKDIFQRAGYFCTDVDPIPAAQTNKNEYQVSIRVHPGEQYRLREIVISGDKTFAPEELRSMFRMKENSVFDTAAVRKGIDAVQKAYLKKGHPNVSIIPSAEVDQGAKTITLTIEIADAAER
jgi:outer membrane protein assembly factor BamA